MLLSPLVIGWKSSLLLRFSHLSYALSFSYLFLSNEESLSLWWLMLTVSISIDACCVGIQQWKTPRWSGSSTDTWGSRAHCAAHCSAWSRRGESGQLASYIISHHICYDIQLYRNMQ